MSQRFILIACVALFLNACVKVQVLPKDTVKNTFRAGKNLYDETKLKRQGATKREYSSQEVVADHPSRKQAEASCISMLKERLKQESTKQDAIVSSESAMLVGDSSDRVIECQVTGYVWL